jgi:hypothetical protein
MMCELKGLTGECTLCSAGKNWLEMIGGAKSLDEAEELADNLDESVAHHRNYSSLTLLLDITVRRRAI